jgi:hypothetical protein
MQRRIQKSRFNFLINVSLVLASGLISLFLFDWVFIKYENTFLQSSSQDIQVLENETFDLASLGFKEKTVSASKTPNTIRILSIGDSFAYAAVPAPYTYSDVLESVLNQTEDDRNFEVINLGIPGISFPEYLAQFEFWSSRLDFDGVIFNFYTGNDLVDMEWLPYSKKEEIRFKNGEFHIGKGTWVPRLYPFRFLDYAKAYYSMYMPKVQEFLYSDSQTIKRASLFTWHHALSNNIIAGTENLKLPPFYIKAMRRASIAYRLNKAERTRNGYLWLLAVMELAQKTIESGKFALILNSPSNLAFSKNIQELISELEGIPEGTLDPHLPGAMVAVLAEMLQFKGGIIDPLDCLASYAEAGKELYFSNYSDTHWTREGNEIVGRILADHILKDWLKIERSEEFPVCPDVEGSPKKNRLGAEIALSTYKAWLTEQP